MDSPSSRERNDADLLLTEATELAIHFLESSGEFYPFAIVLDSADQVQHVQVYAGEAPTVADVYDQLLRGLRNGAAGDGYRALAVVRNVRLTDTQAGKTGDAISVAIEHSLGHAVQCFVPYLLESGQCTTEPPRATPGVRTVFGN
jgi:hypothetical protein